MLISKNSINTLIDKVGKSGEVFCSGLFLSARWFAVSQYDHDGLQMIVMPDKDSAEYCAADLYNLIEGDRVFFLPDSGKSLERSNYKSSLGVQRTSAIGKILEYEEGFSALFSSNLGSSSLRLLCHLRALKQQLVTEYLSKSAELKSNSQTV